MDKFEIIEDILQYKHLSIFENKVIYLGYDIGATKTERAILQTLIQNTKSPLSAEELPSLSGLEMTKENVTYHISSINHKAKLIGNRILIKNIVKKGYFLNEEM